MTADLDLYWFQKKLYDFEKNVHNVHLNTVYFYPFNILRNLRPIEGDISTLRMISLSLVVSGSMLCFSKFQVIVPLPSFEAGTQTPLDNSHQGQERVTYFKIY